MLFRGFLQRLDRGKHGAVFLFKACLIVPQPPKLECFDLAHDARDHILVFVVCLFHHTVFLSQLFSSLAKTPLDRTLGHIQFCGDLCHRQSFEIVKVDRLADLFTQRIDRRVKILVALCLGKSRRRKLGKQPALVPRRQLHILQNMETDVGRTASVVADQRPRAVFRNGADP